MKRLEDGLGALVIAVGDKIIDPSQREEYWESVIDTDCLQTLIHQPLDETWQSWWNRNTPSNLKSGLGQLIAGHIRNNYYRSPSLLADIQMSILQGQRFSECHPELFAGERILTDLAEEVADEVRRAMSYNTESSYEAGAMIRAKLDRWFESTPEARALPSTGQGTAALVEQALMQLARVQQQAMLGIISKNQQESAQAALQLLALVRGWGERGAAIDSIRDAMSFLVIHRLKVSDGDVITIDITPNE